MNSGTAPPNLEDLANRVAVLEKATGPQDLLERVTAIETARGAENLLERIRTLEANQNLAERVRELETIHRTEDLAEKVRAAEATRRTENVAARVTTLETSQRADNLAARVQALEAAQNTLGINLTALQTATITDRQMLVYEHAAQWLRMVNTTVWTLNSIFLVGSILALNGASQIPSNIHWKDTVGWIVFVLCVVWFIADATYTASGWRARYLLSSFEETFLQNGRLYSWPADLVTWWEKLYWFVWIVFQVATYVPVVGIAYLAYTNFIQG